MANGDPNATYNDGIDRRWMSVAWAEFEALAQLAYESEAFSPFVTNRALGVLREPYLGQLFEEFWLCACELTWPFREGSLELLEQDDPNSGFPDEGS